MYSFVSALSVLAALVAVANAMPYQVPLMGSAAGKRTAVVVDDLNVKFTHSRFFENLAKDTGSEPQFFLAAAKEFQLYRYGERLFDNLVVFAPSADKIQGLSGEDVQQFTSDGGNVLVGLSKDVSDGVRELVEGLGVSVDRKGSEVVDFVSHAGGSGNLVEIPEHNVAPQKYVLPSVSSDDNSGRIYFRGISHTVDDDNILALRVLVGNPSTASLNLGKSGDSQERSGSAVSLVTAIQARNNARVVVSGSVDMFSNQLFSVESQEHKNKNADVTGDLARWCFGKRGVLRFREVAHIKSDGTPPDVILHEKHRPDAPITLYPDPEITRNSLVYRIKDEIIFSLVVEEYVNDAWVPYVADDMQMEFVMMDPYIRKTLTHSKGKYFAKFTAPDNYGVFKFRVFYRRPGLSVLHAETQVSIRPFKHDEYERFIPTAYPYYASSISGAAAFLIFSLFYLFSDKR